MGVSPFGHPRIVAYLQLPAAFRSLSRPSSAPDAKAFTLCSSSLELPSARLSPYLLFLASLSNCLSFFVFGLFRFEKALLFLALHLSWLLCLSASLPRFGEIVLPYFLQKNLYNSSLYLSSFCSFLLFLALYSVFNEHESRALPFFMLRSSLDSGFLPVVGTSGLEPPTSRLSGARSNQLSYAPSLRSFQ